jgi:DNA repair protein RecO (recombination protein O)
MYFKTEGVILKRKNFGEADRILTIYTKDFGKVTALAKGVRRPRSKKAGHLELGNWCKVFIAKGKSMDLLTEVELKKAFGIADFSESKTNKIFHILEIVHSMTPDHQKNTKIFSLLVSFLYQIAKEKDFNLISSVFKIKLMAELGYFSAKSLKDSKTKKVFEIIEEREFGDIEENLNLSQESYLNLLSFLDSMIENLTQSKLKTVRFLN